MSSFPIGNQRLEWFEFFEGVDSSIDWKDYPQMRNEFDQVRRDIVKSSLEIIAQTVFNKTYFSLEETGLGYPTVPLSAVRDAAEQDAVAAYMRVLVDSYRVNESPFDDTPKDWAGVNDIGPNDRTFRFAVGANGDSQQATIELGRILDVLNSQQHSGGIIHTGKINIKVPSPNDPYWRCDR